MKCFVIFLTLFTVRAFAEIPPKTLGEVFLLERVTEVIVFEGNYEPEKRPPIKLKTAFSGQEECKKILAAIGSKRLLGGEDTIPFAPFLCHLVLLDSQKEVISVISVLTISCHCIARPGKRNKNGRVIPNYDAEVVEFHGHQLGWLMYKELKKKDPKYLIRLQEMFTGSSPPLSEEMFGKKGAARLKKEIE